MAQGVTGESLKQAFNDFQSFRKAGKIVVDYSLLSSIVPHFTAKNSPKRLFQNPLKKIMLPKSLTAWLLHFFLTNSGISSNLFSPSTRQTLAEEDLVYLTDKRCLASCSY